MREIKETGHIPTAEGGLGYFKTQYKEECCICCGHQQAMEGGNYACGQVNRKVVSEDFFCKKCKFNAHVVYSDDWTYYSVAIPKNEQLSLSKVIKELWE